MVAARFSHISFLGGSKNAVQSTGLGTISSCHDPSMLPLNGRKNEMLLSRFFRFLTRMSVTYIPNRFDYLIKRHTIGRKIEKHETLCGTSFHQKSSLNTINSLKIIKFLSTNSHLFFRQFQSIRY